MFTEANELMMLTQASGLARLACHLLHLLNFFVCHDLERGAHSRSTGMSLRQNIGISAAKIPLQKIQAIELLFLKLRDPTRNML